MRKSLELHVTLNAEVEYDYQLGDQSPISPQQIDPPEGPSLTIDSISVPMTVASIIKAYSQLTPDQLTNVKRHTDLILVNIKDSIPRHELDGIRLDCEIDIASTDPRDLEPEYSSDDY